MQDLAASFSNFVLCEDQYDSCGATYSVYTHLLHDHRPTSNTMWRYVLSLHSPPPRSQTNIQYHVALRTQSTLTSSTITDQHPIPCGATYSVYTHLLHDHRPTSNTMWRYVLSLHSPPPRSQTNIQYLHSLALRTQSTLTSSTITDQHPIPCGSQLHSIPAATTSDIRNLLNKSPTTSCALDPLPTWLLKYISDTLIPFLTRFVNSSITSSVVPRCLKHANVIPVLKKANLDHNNMNRYRPIANMPFVSNLLERYVTRCLIKHLTYNNLLGRYQ